MDRCAGHADRTAGAGRAHRGRHHRRTGLDATLPAAVPIRDSALGALGIAAPVLLRPAFLWLPTLLAVLLSVPGILLIPDAFFTGPLSGRQLTPAEARAFFDTIQQQMAPFVLVSLIETFVILPFVTVIAYSTSRSTSSTAGRRTRSVGSSCGRCGC